MNKFNRENYVVPIVGHRKIYMVMAQHTENSEALVYNGNIIKKIKNYVDIQELETGFFWDNINPNMLELYKN